MAGGKVETGASRFEGAIFSKWYGWARRGKEYRESSKLRFFKPLALLDARREARKLG